MWLSKVGLIFIASFIATLALSACGFHLRGGSGIEGLDSLVLDLRDMRSGIAPGLSRSLKSSGIAIVSDNAPRLHVLDDKFSQRVLSVDRNKRALEYEIVYEVRFVLEDVNGQAFKPASSIVLSRDFLNDEENVLGTSTQTDTVRDEMRRDMVQAVMRKLSILWPQIGREESASSK